MDGVKCHTGGKIAGNTIKFGPGAPEYSHNICAHHPCFIRISDDWMHTKGGGSERDGRA